MKHVSPETPTEDDEAPLDPATERVQKKLKRLLFISTSTMGLGFLTVAFAIFYRLSVADGSDPVSGPLRMTLDFPIATNERVVSADFGESDVRLVLEGPEGIRFVVLDPVLGEVRQERILPRR